MHRGCCNRKIQIVLVEGKIDQSKAREMKQEYIDQSIDDLKLARSLEFESPEVHNNLGLSFMENEWYEQAVESFKRAHSKDELETQPSYINNWALALYYLGMKKNSKEYLNLALEKFDLIIDSVDTAEIPRFKTYLNKGNVLLAKA
jgi:tetratricopeptide (TPR) repeat protein